MVLEASDGLGSSISGLGDLNGDLVADALVGSAKDDDGGFDRGAVYVIFLSSRGAAISFQKISALYGSFTAVLDDSDYFGVALAVVDDVNSDSIADILIGASGDDDGGSDRGAVYVVFLATHGRVQSFQKLSSAAGGFTSSLDDYDSFGSSVGSGLADLNGDAVPDILVGSPGDDDGGVLTESGGACFVVFLQSNGRVLSFQKISRSSGYFTASLSDTSSSGNQFGYNFGQAVSGLQNVDASAAGAIVGANYADLGSTNRGVAFVLFLFTTGVVQSFQKLGANLGGFTGTIDSSDFFGCSVAGLGDQDRDSFPDVAVGACGDDDGGTDCGAVYLIFLYTNGFAKRFLKLSSRGSSGFTGLLDSRDAFGAAISGLLDMNGDSTPELLVGSPQDDDGSFDAGAVYIVFLGFYCFNRAPSGVGYSSYCSTVVASPGDSCTQLCTEGYADNNQGAGQSYTCAGEAFIGTLLTCAASACLATQVPFSNYAAQGSITGTTGQSRTVTCDSGFSGGGTVVCGSDGYFSNVICAGNWCCTVLFVSRVQLLCSHSHSRCCF